jgi:hypothetical protein
VPSQVPPHPEPSSAQTGRTPCGAVPAAVGEQVPALPRTSQAWHWPVQVESQQTPSVQKPLAHWSAALHAAPGASVAAQTPPEHQLPLAQSASPRQLPAQAFAPQR